MSLTFETEPKQTFTAEFDLQGDAQIGEMQFYTSLGTTLAQAKWDKDGAELLSQGKASLHFNSIQALSQKYMGATLPVEMIFAWANGSEPKAPEGWSLVQSAPTISATGPGELRATRVHPLPVVQLRVWLKRTSE